MANNFKEFMRMKEGLQTQFGDRGPGSVADAAAKGLGDMAADFVPGGGIAKAAGEFLWDIIANRRQRVNFAELNGKASEHKHALAEKGIPPDKVFHLDDNLARLLSDEAIWDIMKDTIDKLDKIAPNGYKGLPKAGNLVELVAVNKLKPYIQSMQGVAPRAIPVSA